MTDSDSDNDSQSNSDKAKQGMNGIGPSVAPSVTIVVGDGDVVVNVNGDEETTFREAVQAAHVEAQHFSEDNVFVEDRRPNVVTVDPNSDEDW